MREKDRDRGDRERKINHDRQMIDGIGTKKTRRTFQGDKRKRSTRERRGRKKEERCKLDGESDRKKEEERENRRDSEHNYS